jgi:microcompartment protein CcmK/EutM
VKSGGLSIRFEIDLVAIGAGRNEITLMVSGPRAARASLTRTERRLARLLAHRVD